MSSGEGKERSVGTEGPLFLRLTGWFGRRIGVESEEKIDGRGKKRDDATRILLDRLNEKRMRSSSILIFIPMTNEQFVETIDRAAARLFLHSLRGLFDGRVGIDIAGKGQRRALTIDEEMFDTQGIIADLDWIEKIVRLKDIRR